jgi:hypothetical protein
MAKRMILAAASVATAANASSPPLELVFVERCGRKESLRSDMPVRILDAEGKVVFDGHSKGPYFHARLPKGRYIVSTRWDALSSSRPVTIGNTRQRIVFAWGAPSGMTAGPAPAPQNRWSPPKA